MTIIQKWAASIDAMRLSEFTAALQALNEIYARSDRTPWGRLHHPLYGGHTVQMERTFPDMAAIDADESRGSTPEIREAKKVLLQTVVPGTVTVSVYQTVMDLEPRA